MEQVNHGSKHRISLMAIIVMAILVVVAAIVGYRIYGRMASAVEQYTLCETAADELQAASDYLTEQVRLYAMTADVSHMENYFTEAHVTCRREQALNTIATYFAGSEAFDALAASYQNSYALMDVEYRSMRLMAEATNLPREEWPEEIAAITLSGQDADLSPAEKQKKAQDILFDGIYLAYKRTISENASASAGELLADADAVTKYYERLFIITYMLTVVFLLAVTALSVALFMMRRREREQMRQLAEAKRTAEAASNAKTEFFFRMSHELHTPMNAILGLAELMKKKHAIASDPQLSTSLDRMMTAGRSLDEKLDAILQESSRVFGTEEAAAVTAKTEAEPVEGGNAAGGTASLAGRRVLVVDDNSLNAEIAMDLLAEHGIAAEMAESGNECLALLNANPAGYYDAILMDINMPEMDGHETTRRIRSLEDAAKAATPVVALSANCLPEDIQNATGAGMDDFLKKPIEVETLLETLGEAIGRVS